MLKGTPAQWGTIFRGSTRYLSTVSEAQALEADLLSDAFVAFTFPYEGMFAAARSDRHGGWKTPALVARYTLYLQTRRGAMSKLAAKQGRI